MSQSSFATERGERKSQSIRPATLTYPVSKGTPLNIPCTLGNLDFFRRYDPMGAGWNQIQQVTVKMLRIDIPPLSMQPPNQFQRGQAVTLTNNDPDSPGVGESWSLIIGENNTVQPDVMILRLEKQIA